MGASNAVAAFDAWGDHLDHGPFRLLVHMALTSKDSDPVPRYWGGRELMARAMGLQWGDKKSRNALDYAVRVLRKRGAIELEAKPAPGRGAAYRLRLEPNNGPDSVSTTDLTQSANGPDSVSKRALLSQAPRSSEEEEEHGEEPNHLGSPGAPGAGLGYEQASNRLAQLPDLGAAALAAVPDDVTGYTARVIHAARHLEEA